MADVVWAEFGDPASYNEPFFGTGAVLLARPSQPRVETVNDSDAFLSNFWRAVQAAPDEVAQHADYPVMEACLHARHRWLIAQDGFRERMLEDPDYYDAKIAAWWVWGACAWIGRGWCGEGAGWKQLPNLGNAGRGIHRPSDRHRLPEIFRALSERLRGVRVACGNWTRVLTNAVTVAHGITAVFLDPPYAEGADDLYTDHDKSVSGAVRQWALEHGDDPQMRICLAGYEGEHQMHSSWRCHKWKARKGYQGSDNKSNERERLWFSPHYLGSSAARGPLAALFEQARLAAE